ncbi:MAG: glyceraldehyde 3-phosphate dehydrogenase NAD-binding domain-containing protein [Candidatus Jorgensenbacteria bacterium]
MAKIAINGFGRIGRLFFRAAFDKSSASQAGLDIVAVNDLGDCENLAYLLKYDTVYGRWDKEVRAEGDYLVVGGKSASRRIKFFQEKDPVKLPWGKLRVDIVVESTGVFEEYKKAKVHLEAGAKRVVITAPAKDSDGSTGRTVLMGVNGDEAKGVALTSNGSCTTNAASPVIQIMSENPGIKKAILNTVHGYTATQNLVDGPVKGKDFRRGRAAAQNIVLSSTGAATAVTRAVRGLAGKFDGIAMRVPVVNGSIADITFLAARKTSVEEINDILKKAAKSPRWKGILKVAEGPIVSSDVIGEPYGAIVDLEFTRVIDGDLVKVLSWYDNEAGYVATLVGHVLNVASLI